MRLRNEEWQAVRRVLAVRTGTAADVILLGPALRMLKAALSEAHVTLLTSPAGQDAAGLLPWVDRALVHQAVWDGEAAAAPVDIEQQLDLVELLEAEHCDAAVIFTSAAQSPWPAAYAAYLARVPLRLGQSKEAGGALLTHWARPLPDDAHEVDRNLYLLETAGLPVAGRQLELRVPDTAQAAVERLLVQLRIPPGEPYVAVAPGMAPSSRRYPADRYIQVCQIVTRQTGVPVVILGTRADVRLGARIVAETVAVDGRHVASVAGQTSLAEMAALVERASVVIANHSVVMHLADAAGRPLVVPFAGTVPLARWRPRSAATTVLQQPVGCSPCHRETCPYDKECLDLPAGLVAAEVVRRLEHDTGWAPTTVAATVALEPQAGMVDGAGDPGDDRPAGPAADPSQAPFESEIPLVTVTRPPGTPLPSPPANGSGGQPPLPPAGHEPDAHPAAGRPPDAGVRSPLAQTGRRVHDPQ